MSPFEDARRKVALVRPQGKTVLDTCGGLGYFAACCLEAGAIHIRSFEKILMFFGYARSILGLQILRRYRLISALSWLVGTLGKPLRIYPMPVWMPLFTIRHASVLPGSYTRYVFTISWHGYCAVVDRCSTTPAHQLS